MIIASQSDVNRGFANSAARSGVAVEALQNAGNRTLGLASKWMDQALARLNTLTYRWNVKFMPPNKWHKYVDKYPINVLSDMIKRAGEAEFNVRVETSGTKNIQAPGQAAESAADERKQRHQPSDVPEGYGDRQSRAGSAANY